MEDTPPRRSRPKPPSGSSAPPVIPIFIGVVVLGFVIGAGLSVMGKHGSPGAVAQATTSPEASAAVATRPPTPIPASPRHLPSYATTPPLPTPIPARSPLASSSSLPTSKASSEPSATPAGAQTASPTATARVPAATVAVVTHHPATPMPGIMATRAPTAAPTYAPTAAPTVAPTVAQTSPPTTVLDADTEFSKLAGNVVRQYLLSIARGDSESAYAALGDSPGSHAGSLPEAGTLDSTMHISKIEARGSDSSSAVTVDLTTSAGPYYGQYTVHKSSTGAAIIVSHTFGKP